jgi:signal transduction histidine kinase
VGRGGKRTCGSSGSWLLAIACEWVHTHAHPAFLAGSQHLIRRVDCVSPSSSHGTGPLIDPKNGDQRDWIAGGGDMGAFVRSLDWSKTALGPLDVWPQSLRTTVSTCLSSRFPILIWWGPELVMIYNDALSQIIGNKHPRAMGQRGAEGWWEVWELLGTMLRSVLAGGPSTWSENQRLDIERSLEGGYLEETYFTFSYSPIRDESGGIGGVFCAVTETTAQVLGERRLRTLTALAQHTAEATTATEACLRAALALQENPLDIPAAFLYLADRDGKPMRLASTVGVTLPEGRVEDMSDPKWPLAAVLKNGEALIISPLIHPATDITEFAPTSLPTAALLLPFGVIGKAGASGVLVIGLAPRLLLDDRYRSFLELVAGHIGTAIASARALQAAEERADTLAQLDRAKTAFFSNVSHEFRTPLTLMLGPTEDALASETETLSGVDLKTVYRNELRLLRLVNTLLDFSRIEAGRAEASFEPADLSELTEDLASAFRSTIERAGLRFDVDCPPVGERIFVDREMWEKIVLNLLSNAFKFTFEGSIGVAFRVEGGIAQLQVRDSGVGIAESELPRLFERFHRIEGTRSRSHEGTGIGLALVRDLVRLHGGDISVESNEPSGSTFTVSIPTGSAHLPSDRLRANRAVPLSGIRDHSFVTEVMSWGPHRAEEAATPLVTELTKNLTSLMTGARVLIVDDNLDMREYLARLLRRHWLVDTAADGLEAIAVAQHALPSLVLTDVMMPNLDGFGLLRALRAEPRTRLVPVIMLSARAGEESRVEGIAEGADDYLIKPFSAKELLARVAMHLELGRLRRASELERERLTLLMEERETLHAERAQLLQRASDARAEAELASLAKDEFLAMLGHELRNPLAPIVTALQLLRRRGSDPMSPEHEIIERQVKHLTTLVDDLLDISSITRGKVELHRASIELSRLVERSIEIASPLIGQRGHELIVSVPVTGLAVSVDPVRLVQVISNLLTNAAKYTDPGGRIAVTATISGADVQLSVSDNGIGISVSMQPHVFELFMQEQQTIDRPRGGLGLGLAIVQNLMTLHGGSVSVSSQGLGTGSMFTLLLPLTNMAIVSEVGAEVLHPAQQSVRRKVLIVDDSIDAADMMSQAMTELGCDTQVAQDGIAALSLVASFRPDLILMDIGLPGMNGYELAARLRQLPMGPDLRLIAITGYGQKGDIDRAFAAGFDEHLVKPVEFEKLEALLTRLRTSALVA